MLTFGIYDHLGIDIVGFETSNKSKNDNLRFRVWKQFFLLRS